jgi:hypothetical protein
MTPSAPLQLGRAYRELPCVSGLEVRSPRLHCRVPLLRVHQAGMPSHEATLLSPGVRGSLQGGDALPEALAADARRLAEAQAGVAAALLLRQHAAATRCPLPAGMQGHIFAEA